MSDRQTSDQPERSPAADVRGGNSCGARRQRPRSACAALPPAFTRLPRQTATQTTANQTAAPQAGATQYGRDADGARRASLLLPQRNSVRDTIDLSGLWDFQLDPRMRRRGEPLVRAAPTPRPIAVPCSWNELFDDARDYLGLAAKAHSCITRGFRRIAKAAACSCASVPRTMQQRWQGERTAGGAAPQRTLCRSPPISPISSRGIGRMRSRCRREQAVARARPRRPLAGRRRHRRPDRRVSGHDLRLLPLRRTPSSGPALFGAGNIRIDNVGVITDIERRRRRARARRGEQHRHRHRRQRKRERERRLQRTRHAASEQYRHAADLPCRSGPKPDPACRQRASEIPGITSLSADDHPRRHGSGKQSTTTDAYTLDIGIRTIAVRGEQLLLNGQPIILKGFGLNTKDFAINGRGLNIRCSSGTASCSSGWARTRIARRTIRTLEEAMTLADRLGFLVIDEIPAVSLNFNDTDDLTAQRLTQCLQQIEELVERDRNHPSVIMWCVAGMTDGRHAVARRGAARAGELLQARLRTHPLTRSSRPITLVGVQGGPPEWLGLFDVVSINRYYGWYSQRRAARSGGRSGWP